MEAISASLRLSGWRRSWLPGPFSTRPSSLAAPTIEMSRGRERTPQQRSAPSQERVRKRPRVLRRGPRPLFDSRGAPLARRSARRLSENRPHPRGPGRPCRGLARTMAWVGIDHRPVRWALWAGQLRVSLEGLAPVRVRTQGAAQVHIVGARRVEGLGSDAALQTIRVRQTI